MTQADLFFWYNVFLGWSGGFVLGAAWMIWKTRHWDEPIPSPPRSL